MRTQKENASRGALFKLISRMRTFTHDHLSGN